MHCVQISFGSNAWGHQLSKLCGIHFLLRLHHNFCNVNLVHLCVVLFVCLWHFSYGNHIPYFLTYKPTLAISRDPKLVRHDSGSKVLEKNRKISAISRDQSFLTKSYLSVHSRNLPLRETCRKLLCRIKSHLLETTKSILLVVNN